MKYRVTIETIPERPSDPEPGSTTRTSMHLHSAIAYAMQDCERVRRGDYYLSALILSLIEQDFVEDGSKELNALYALASKMQTKALKKLKAVKS